MPTSPPGQVTTGGGGTPRYLPPPGQVLMGRGTQGTYPPARSQWGEAVPQGTYPQPDQVLMGEGVPQGTYHPPRPGRDRGRGYPKVSTPHPPGQGLATRRAVCLLRSRRRICLVLKNVIMRKSLRKLKLQEMFSCHRLFHFN